MKVIPDSEMVRLGWVRKLLLEGEVMERGLDGSLESDLRYTSREVTETSL